MNEVRYYSRGGNTKKIADAIANGLGITAKTIEEPLSEPVDMLFLGSSVYKFGIDKSVKEFISGLDSKKVKSVALFGTSSISKSGNNKMKKLLMNQGVSVIDADFHCYGEFASTHKGKPDEADMNRAVSFAKSVTKH